MNSRPVISPKEARKILGKSAKDLSDLEVIEATNVFRFIAIKHLKNKYVKKSNIGLGL